MKKITFLLFLNLIIQNTFAQDTCATAFPISAAGTFVVAAINGTQVPTPICAENGVIAGTNAAGEWYSYTPMQNYTVTVTSDIVANTPRKDTRVHVYIGGCADLTCYASDDDSGVGANNYSSVCTFNVFAGVTYYIAWDNRWSSTGFTFDLLENPIILPPVTPISYVPQNIATINSQFNLCSVDMNNDHLDDIVGISSSNIRIHYQNANGTFTMTDIPASATGFMPTWSLAAGDYNKDGYNDLIYGNGQGVAFMKSNATGTAYSLFAPTQYVFSQRTNFIDINNDGNLDAFACHDVDPNVYYINDGTGNLNYFQSGVSPGAALLGITPNGGNYGSIWVDYDNDRDLDLFIAKCGSVPPDELHRNNGDGTFSDISIPMNLYDAGQSWSAAWADYDNDGDMDALVGASSGAHVFKRNDLNLNNTTEEPFVDITAGSGWDTNLTTSIEHIAHDFDNDGFVDIMGGGNKIMFNQGNMTFAPSNYPFSVGAIGDFNNDGFLDIQDGSTLYKSVPNTNNWLKINLKGTFSNSNGIGARIEIYGAWGKQIRDVRSGDGFKYMSSLNTHFGIGQATAIDKLVVLWPSGKIDTILNPGINQALLITEATTNLANDQFVSTSEFSIYPNPATDILNISFKNSNEIKSAQIIDINGKLISNVKVNNNTIDIKSLAKGTYVLVIKNNDGKQFSEKFLKK
jgi:ASPIC and UnbV/Secretion system C-terminal sorting domain/FG-GAP-like repeat